MELDALVTRARQHCQSLDESMRRQLGQVQQLEQRVGLLNDGVRRSTEELVQALGLAQQELHKVREEGQTRTSTIKVALNDAAEHSQQLQGGLASHLEAVPGALTGVREQAREALPRLGALAEALQASLEELTDDVEASLAELATDLEEAERQAQAMCDAAGAGREALEESLTECLQEADQLEQQAKQALENLAQRITQQERSLSGGMQTTHTALQQGAEASRQQLTGTLHDQLVAHVDRETERIQAAVQSLQSATDRGVAAVVDEGQSLHSILGDLCHTLQPLVTVHDEGRRLGAIDVGT